MDSVGIRYGAQQPVTQPALRGLRFMGVGPGVGCVGLLETVLSHMWGLMGFHGDDTCRKTQSSLMFCIGGGFHTDSLNYARLDYIWSGKLFSGLSQRQTRKCWQGGKSRRHCSEVDWKHYCVHRAWTAQIKEGKIARWRERGGRCRWGIIFLFVSHLIAIIGRCLNVWQHQQNCCWEHRIFV